MSSRLRTIVLATAPPLPPRPAPGAPSSERLQWAWRRATHGWPAAYPLAQFPNVPLLLSFAASALEGNLAGGAQPAARAAASVFLGVWAWLELAAGVNLWRRVLGAGGLAWVIVRLGEQIG
jgi:hypothetical protein